jgi:DNA-binding transcriptional LysR family regulator
MLSVTLRQLEYACAVARHGGMTAAAEALHVSQPALSVALGQLETQLGQALFLRRPGGRMVPSPFGRGWIDAAQGQLDAFARLMTGGLNTATPTRLAVFEDLAPFVLAPLLRRLPDTVPAMMVAPSVMSFEALTEGLRQGHTDLALTWDLGLDTGMIRHVLAHVAPHAVLAPDHPLAHQSTVRLADLAPYPLILTDQGLSVGHIWTLFTRAGLSPTISHRTATLDLMRSFAANGLGIGVSYSHPASPISHDGRPLITRPLRDAGKEPIVLVHARGNPVSDVAQGLAQLIKHLLPFAPHIDSIAQNQAGESNERPQL